MALKKNIAINFLILIIMLLVAETAARVYLSRKEFNNLAIIDFATKVKVYLTSRKYKSNKQKENIELKCFKDFYYKYSEENFSPFYEKYEQGFNEFLKITNNTPVIILYLPSAKRGDWHRQYFSQLAEKNSLEFLDMSKTLRNSGEFDTWTLAPENGHLSRFGNKVIANKLTNHINSKFNDLGKKIERNKRVIKSQIASLERSKSSIWNVNPSMVYRVYTNKNGFRSKDEIVSDSDLIIVYGDSFTFGPYLPNHDTYTALANKNLAMLGKKNIQILNAGIAGTTIYHQTETLKNTIKLEPHLIILQVLDNDIFGVSYPKMLQIQPVPISDTNLLKPSSEELKIIENCNL